MNRKRWSLIKAVFIILIPSVLILRLFTIQVWQHKVYSNNITKQISSKIEIIVPRGDILDRNNRILATSIILADVYLYSEGFLFSLKHLGPKDIEKNFRMISSLLNISKDEILNKCKQNKRFCIATEVDLIKAINLKYIPGIEIETYQKRVYPYEEFTNSITGKINNDGYGYSGVEYAYNDVLSSINKTEINVYRSGRLSKSPVRLIDIANIEEFINTQKNCNINLTIDIPLQSRIFSILKKFYEIYTPKLIMCIVQRVDTGEILAMTIYPERNPPMENPAVSWNYEPGSIFKIFPMAIFIEKNVADPLTVIHCENGKFLYLNHEFSDVKPHGNLSAVDILVHSSNIGMVKLYLKYGNVNEYFYYLKLFGFGSLTGIELPSETKGFLPTPQTKTFSSLTPLNISFGQGIGVTPIQIVNGYTMVANNGYLLQPFIVKRITNAKQEIIYSGKKRILRKVISEQTCDIIKNMMYETVERGTAQKAKINNLKLCAKTGTAQKFDFTIGKYSPMKYLMSCCGFFPLEKPEFTVGVFIDEPKNARLASEVAVPIFKEVVLEILNHYKEVAYAKAY
ncbi:MAG: penicillin-binding protein 2 [Endomicrobia bacterium]|nr:penicillin-binding protein 2 [Endomicrobiia bacterium]